MSSTAEILGSHSMARNVNIYGDQFDTMVSVSNEDIGRQCRSLSSLSMYATAKVKGKSYAKISLRLPSASLSI
jgi:hypothetical protein